MPTGKQNTFANRTVPDAVIISLRDDQPVNLVGAFEDPVKGGEGGYINESVKKLVDQQNIITEFANKPVWTIGCGKALEAYMPISNLEDSLKMLEQKIAEKTVN